MSVAAITWALEQRVGSSAAKFVLVVMADCADKESGFAFPSVAYLAEATDLDRKTVMRALERLQADGFITDTGLKRGRTRQVIVYRLNSTKNGTLSELDQSTASESEAQRGPQGIEPHDENGTVPKTGPFPSSSAEAPEANSPESGTVSDSNDPKNGTVPEGNSPISGGKQSQKRYTEPRANQDQNLQPRPSAGAPEREGEGEQAGEQDPKPEPPKPFALFWETYPKQIARADCERRWRVMDLDALAETILVDVRNRRMHDPEWLRGFIPNPRTYLDGRRWEDKPPGVAAAVDAATAPRPNVLANPLDPLNAELAMIADRFRFDDIDAAERDRLIAKAREKHGVPA